MYLFVAKILNRFSVPYDFGTNIYMHVQVFLYHIMLFTRLLCSVILGHLHCRSTAASITEVQFSSDSDALNYVALYLTL